MKALLQLEQLGYTFTVDNDTIRYRLDPNVQINHALASPLLEELKADKPSLLDFLQIRVLERPGYVVILSPNTGKWISINEKSWLSLWDADQDRSDAERKSSLHDTSVMNRPVSSDSNPGVSEHQAESYSHQVKEINA